MVFLSENHFSFFYTSHLPQSAAKNDRQQDNSRNDNARGIRRRAKKFRRDGWIGSDSRGKRCHEGYAFFFHEDFVGNALIPHQNNQY